MFQNCLHFEQKQGRMDIAEDVLTTFNDVINLLKKVITGDESWVYGYNIEIEAQSSKLKRPVKTEKSFSSLVKCEGVVYCFLRFQ